MIPKFILGFESPSQGNVYLPTFAVHAIVLKVSNGLRGGGGG